MALVLNQINIREDFMEELDEKTQRPEPIIHILLQPEDKKIQLPRKKTVKQLLSFLNIPEETALVARDGELLTPDRRIFTGDEILVRKVTSAG